MALLTFSMSILMMVHIFNFAALWVSEDNVHPFLNNLVEYLEGSRVGFLGTLSFLTFCGYLFAAAHRGNTKIGQRFFFINFYPTLPRETFISGFFANCIMTNIWSFAVLQFCVQLFRTYLRGTDIAKIYEVQVKYLIGIGWFY
jgi:hypothetical protein